MSIDNKIKEIDIEINKLTVDLFTIKYHLDSYHGLSDGFNGDYFTLLDKYNKSVSDIKDYNKQKNNLYVMKQRMEKINKIKHGVKNR